MDHLVVGDADGVRTITINRPEVKNALTAAMRAEFCAAVADADADEAVRAIVVTAVDPVFSAGVDFKEVAAGGGRARRPLGRARARRACRHPSPRRGP